MRYLGVEDVVRLYLRVMAATGGAPGLRDRGLLESAVAQPRMTFGGEELYPTLEEKAAALGYSLGSNHAFLDGNKRIALAATEAFLRLNGFRLAAGDDELEAVFLGIASGEWGRDRFAEWIRGHLEPRSRGESSTRPD